MTVIAGLAGTDLILDRDRIFNLGQHVLEVINSVFEQASVKLPSKQYVAIGPTAHDCEQVTVGFEQIYLGPPGLQAEEPQQCNVPRSVVWRCEVVRQVPVVSGGRAESPSAKRMNEYAKEQLRDMYLLLEAGAYSDEDWLGVITDGAVTQAQGGYQAAILNLVMGLT